MQFTVSSKKLFTKLQAAAQVINKKNTLPILDCFLLGLRGNILNIASTCGEVRLVTKVEVQDAEGDIKIAVNAQTLVSALKKLPDQPITFKVNEDNFEVFIHYHNGKFNFIGQSADDYPIPRLLDEKVKQELTIDADVLLNGIGETMFAVSDDELRPTMEAIFIDITTDNITFVASDGHKLVKLTNIDTRGKSNASFLLSKKAASILLKLLPKETSQIKVRFDFNNAVFDLSDYSITTRFIDGKYPNYNSVIPSYNENSFTICKGSLIGILKRVSVFSNQSSNLIKLEISNNALTIKGQDIDFSTAAEENTEIEYNGTPMNIAFKCSFLIELLNSLSSTDVEFKFSEPSKAVLILPTLNLSGFNHLTLLMPMLLSE